jgi:hypothetical protein
MSDTNSTANPALEGLCHPQRQIATGATRAMRLVAWARRNAILEHPSEHLCVDCGNRAAVYDHRNYGRPLDVVPVCRPCNAKRGKAVPAENDEPAIWYEKEGSGYVLSKHGIAPISFEAVDFYPVDYQAWKWDENNG